MSSLHLPSGEVIDIDFEPREIDTTDLLMQNGGQELVLMGERLGPAIRSQFCEILAAPPTFQREGIARPDRWSNRTAFFHARAILDAKIAFEVNGELLRSIEQLCDDAAVFAVIRHYKGQNASRILRGIRPAIRLLGFEFSSRAKRAIGRLAHTPRRDEDEILPTSQSCLRCAWEEFQKALGMMHQGLLKRGKTRLRDAVAMAVEASCAFRRAELVSVDIEMVIDNKNVAEIQVLVHPKDSKVRRLQFGRISDQAVVKMVRELVGDRKNGALLRTNWGSRLAGSSAWAGLRRVGQRSDLNFPLSFNKMRQIGVTAEVDLARQHETIRHLPGSRSTATYQRHDDNLMIDEVRKITREYGPNNRLGPHDRLDRSFRSRRALRSNGVEIDRSCRL